MWDWIKSYRVPFYDTFWIVLGNKEYEFIYNKSVIDELKDLGITNHHEIGKRFNKMIKDLKKKHLFILDNHILIMQQWRVYIECL